MNKSLRPRCWILPVFFLMAASCILTLSGCHEGCSEIPVNEDSARKHAISITEAAIMTANFRKTIDSLGTKCPLLKDSLKLGYAESFNGDTYRILLRQKDSLGHPAAGIRIYYGLKDGQVSLIMVPIDSSGNDILRHLVSPGGTKQVPGVSPAHTQSLVVDDAQAMEEGQHCPTYCPPTTDPLQP